MPKTPPGKRYVRMDLHGEVLAYGDTLEVVESHIEGFLVDYREFLWAHVVPGKSIEWHPRFSALAEDMKRVKR